MAKAPLKFRAVKGHRGIGPLAVEASRDGSVWARVVAGLSVTEVQQQFNRLKAHGAGIVDTEDYKHV